MLGWWLGQGIACLCAFVMSSNENLSPVQWLFSKVSNNLGIPKSYQENSRCCLQSNCNCQAPPYSLLEDFSSLLNLEVPVVDKIKCIETSKTLHEILNAESFKKSLIVWDPNTVDETATRDYNILNSSDNSDPLCISDSHKDFAKTQFTQYNLSKNSSFLQENFNRAFQCSFHKLEPSICFLEVAKGRMVTSPLSSNNVPCNAYPLIDKKKSHTGTDRTSGPPNNSKNSGNKNNRNKENIVKNKESKDPLLEVKKDFTNKKKNENKHINDTQDKGNTQNNKQKFEKLDHCKSNDDKQRSSKQDKGSDLEKVGKLLQEVLWKAPAQNHERNSFAVTEVSSGGSDTGYSSRCSTPPAPGNVEASNEEDKGEKRSSSEIVCIPPPSLEDHNNEPRSQSPSACSDSSSGLHHSYRGGNSYQGYQRFNCHPHYQQKHFQRPHFILPYAKSEEEDYQNQRKQFEDSSFNGRGRGQPHNIIQFRKVDRPSYYHCQNQHSHHNSSHPHSQHHESEYGGKGYNGRQYNQVNMRGDGRARHYWGEGFNQRYHNVKNRQYGNFHHPNGSFFNNPNIYYQTDSHMDLRECVWGFQRTLSGRSGSFTSSSGNQNGKWTKDHRMEATVIPPELLTKSEWDGLSLQVWNLFTKHQQLDSTYRAKMELKQRISHIIWNVLPMCRLFVVGSSLSGFGANSSDVDMCLMVTPRDLDQRNDAQAVLRLLQREFNNCGFVEKMELITAKVPILKFRDYHTKIDVDLNCNNSVGIRNTHLLNAYSQLDWRVRPLVLVVKLWAQHHNINNAKDMTISSYSLVLMVIHYLQHGLDTPLLPCLQKSFPDKFNASNHVFRMPVTERMPVFVSNNSQTLGELFLGFLEYYAHKFTYVENTISVRTGGILPTEDCRFVRTKKNDSRMWKYLCIEEPFDLTNTARSMYDKDVFEKVVSVFKESYKRLKESMDLEVIFSSQ